MLGCDHIAFHYGLSGKRNTREKNPHITCQRTSSQQKRSSILRLLGVHLTAIRGPGKHGGLVIFLWRRTAHEVNLLYDTLPFFPGYERLPLYTEFGIAKAPWNYKPSPSRQMKMGVGVVTESAQTGGSRQVFHLSRALGLKLYQLVVRREKTNFTPAVVPLRDSPKYTPLSHFHAEFYG